MNVLQIDFSGRRDGSVTRQITARLAERLADGGHLVARDYTTGLPFVDHDWAVGSRVPEAERTEAQHAALRTSDRLIDELKAADVLVLGLPVYNFGPPAAFKAWVDQVARAGLTFRYTEAGAIGLVEGVRAYAVVASSGTGVGSDIDFLTPYLRFVLGFIGITDVEVVAADRLLFDPEATGRALERVGEIADEHSSFAS